MDRLTDADNMTKIGELEARLRTSQKREVQLRKQLLFWRGNWVAVFLFCFSIYALNVFFIQCMRATNELIKEAVEKERDAITDCVIPEFERAYDSYLKCFPWLFEEEKEK